MKLREHINKNEIFSLPNMISYIRILLIPVWVWAFFAMPESYLALVLLIVSGLSDMLDGFIARHFGMITNWGKIIDPIADKLTQFTVIVCLAVEFSALWYILSVFVIKDLFLAIGGYALLRRNGKTVGGAQWFGKICTVMFYGIICILLISTLPNVPLGTGLTNILILIFFASAVLALVMYAIQIFRLWNSKD